MVDIYDYDNLLRRAMEQVPETVKEHERFKLPELEIVSEGNQTIFRNFRAFVDAIDRDPQHLYKFLVKELGTAGTVQGDRLIFKGRITGEMLQRRIDEYLKIYVLCYECGSPDTELRKEGRIEMLHCKACGAMRPVTAKAAVKVAEDKIVEGRIYELEITDIGKEGDGVAHKGSYIIYVPGAKKGQRVRVKIVKVRGTRAFGVLVG
jgi:translation initiation factor 2 subunit 2